MPDDPTARDEQPAAVASMARRAHTWAMSPSAPTIAVVIPTLDAARHLPRCLDALATADGLHLDVVIVDGGSTDDTLTIAETRRTRVVASPRGRGVQLATGAIAALVETRADWLLFLHADTVLEPGYAADICTFLAPPDAAGRAAVFRFGLDDDSPQARRLTAMVDWRVRWLTLPYGDQGLLIHRNLYTALGGYRPLPLMEDVDMIRRIGRARLTVLPARAITSADRWRREGWWRRSARNLGCLALYYVGLPPRLIVRLYR